MVPWGPMLVQHGPMLLQHRAGTTRIRGVKKRWYTGCVEPSNISIGEDDTQEWPIWVFYREWQDREQEWSNFLMKNGEKRRILDESGREKSKSRSE